MIGHDKNHPVNPYNEYVDRSDAVDFSRKSDSSEEKFTRAEALKTHTIWPAYLQFAEKERGSIENGKLADLVVIDRDYLTCPEEQIKDIEPVMTILNGRVVYRAQ